jgi:hypothetical protein
VFGEDLLCLVSPEARKERDLKREAEAKQRAEEEQRQKEEEAKRLTAQREAKMRWCRERDADCQDQPFRYSVDGHANAALAIRYGIANQERLVKEYWYHAKGGERRRNPERDRPYFAPAPFIRVQKVRKLSADMYLVRLSDYRDREARAIIEPGTDYIKTFYPKDDEWFTKHADLELVLKGNPTFSLKELAAFHVQKAVSSK